MRVGLVLGGGGTVGIAWEIAVLAGLEDACGFKASSAAVVVGTSAGSVVGALVAQRRNLHEVAEAQRLDRSSRAGTTKAPDFTTGPTAEIFALLMSPEGQTPAGVARMAELATGVETELTAAQFVASFRRTLETDDWPDVDLRITSTSCATGARAVWTAASDIPLTRAVASSCAIPGFYPPIAHGGDLFIDGPRGQGYNAEILAADALDAILFLGPDLGASFASITDREVDALRALGPRFHAITGGEEFRAAGFNLMDPTSRERAVDIGLREGKAEAAAVGALLG